MKEPIQENYALEKSLLTENDFEKMNWHDCHIYACYLKEKFELVFDIDYIFNWVPPTSQNNYYKFWISPCTLVFKNVNNLKFDLEIDEPFEIKIEDILRYNPKTPRNANFISSDTEYEWTIEFVQGQITFNSVGYKLFVRKKPILEKKQSLGIKKRNGVSFYERSIKI